MVGDHPPSRSHRPRRCREPQRASRSDPRPLVPSAYQYLIFHKPYDVLSQFTDRQGHALKTGPEGRRTTLKDYIPLPGIYPVGRLDRDSEGLLLLTNHGRLQHRLSDPAYGHPRTYWIQVEGIPTDDALSHLTQGVVVQGQRTRPAQVQRLAIPPDLPPRHPPIRYRQSIPTSWLELTLREGRNRQVRRMTATVGYPTLRLVRVAIGSLRLADLAPGEWRFLTPEERHSLGARDNQS